MSYKNTAKTWLEVAWNFMMTLFKEEGEMRTWAKFTAQGSTMFSSPGETN